MPFSSGAEWFLLFLQNKQKSLHPSHFCGHFSSLIYPGIVKRTQNCGRGTFSSQPGPRLWSSCHHTSHLRRLGILPWAAPTHPHLEGEESWNPRCLVSISFTSPWVSVRYTESLFYFVLVVLRVSFSSNSQRTLKFSFIFLSLYPKLIIIIIIIIISPSHKMIFT